MCFARCSLGLGGTRRTVRGTSGDEHGSEVRDDGTDSRCARALRTIPGLLPSEALSALSRRCQWRRYHAHQIILGYQDDSREVFFVVRGQVRVTFFSECGREVSFRDLPAGEMFGELSAIDGLPRSCTVVALTDTMVAVMTASLLWDLLRAHGSVNACILGRLTRLVRSLSERVINRAPLRCASGFRRSCYALPTRPRRDRSAR